MPPLVVRSLLPGAGLGERIGFSPFSPSDRSPAGNSLPRCARHPWLSGSGSAFKAVRQNEQSTTGPPITLSHPTLCYLVDEHLGMELLFISSSRGYNRFRFKRMTLREDVPGVGRFARAACGTECRTAASRALPEAALRWSGWEEVGATLWQQGQREEGRRVGLS